MTTRPPTITSHQRDTYVGAGLFGVGAIIVLVALFLWPGWLRGDDNNDSSTPTSDGQQQVALSSTPSAGASATPKAATPASTPTPSAVTTKTAGTSSAKWPTNAAEAAAAFGGDASRWEATADPGGWHLREEAFSVVINPRGFLAEGYFDTKPGKNPQCFAFIVPMGVQGATVWSEAGTRENAEKLQGKMAIPKWDDGQSSHPCQVMAP